VSTTENKEPQMERSAAPRPQRKPRLRLPFDNRREDAGEWAWDHRVGLAVTLIVYLVVGIVFMAGKIAVGEKQGTSTILVDLQTLEQLESERDRLRREVSARLQDEDWRNIRNVASNENALNENLKDDRGTNTSEINSSAEEVQRRMRANREAYERGVAEANEIGKRKDGDKSNEKPSSQKVKGSVTVSYSLKDPLRHHRHLDIPAYRCEGGGEVVVAITVNRSGEVVGAYIKSGGDDCMIRSALESARRSTFDINQSAPAKQSGTITYIFIPQ
jgi:hypothetical protein